MVAAIVGMEAMLVLPSTIVAIIVGTWEGLNIEVESTNRVLHDHCENGIVEIYVLLDVTPYGKVFSAEVPFLVVYAIVFAVDDPSAGPMVGSIEEAMEVVVDPT